MSGVEKMVFPVRYINETIRKYQKLNICDFVGSSCHRTANITPTKMAPQKIYGRRRPHRDLVLSVIYPIIESNRASYKRGTPPNKPARKGSIPKAVIRKNINTPNAPGRRLLTR